MLKNSTETSDFEAVSRPGPPKGFGRDIYIDTGVTTCISMLSRAALREAVPGVADTQRLLRAHRRVLGKE